MRYTALKALLLLMTLSALAVSQQLPDKIRGYKVHRLDINVHTDSADKNVDMVVNLDEPNIEMTGLLTASIEVGGEFTSMTRSGKVDFLMFRDIRVNGIAVDVAEYDSPFEFRKGRTTVLTKPVHGTVRLSGIARAAFKEFADSREEWTVSGTVFVFGKFKKFGFTFKRVVPVTFDLKIANPLAAS